MGQDNQKLILGGILIKIILTIRNNILVNLFSNFLIINGKYPTYHLLFISGEAI